MVGRLLAVFLLASVVVACSSGATVPTNPGATATPAGPGATSGGPDSTPDGGPTTAPGGGDLEARARALIPPGSTETGELSAGGAYQVYVSNPQTLEQLGAFWTQAIPAAGMTESGRFTTGPIMTIAFTNPDGGIVATRDDPQGTSGIIISVGTSQ